MTDRQWAILYFGVCLGMPVLVALAMFVERTTRRRRLQRWVAIHGLRMKGWGDTLEISGRAFGAEVRVKQFARKRRGKPTDIVCSMAVRLRSVDPVLPSYRAPPLAVQSGPNLALDPALEKGWVETMLTGRLEASRLDEILKTLIHDTRIASEKLTRGHGAATASVARTTSGATSKAREVSAMTLAEEDALEEEHRTTRSRRN